MKAVINDATNIRQYAFYKITDYEKKLNHFLELEAWEQAGLYIDELARDNWLTYLHVDKKEAEKLPAYIQSRAKLYIKPVFKKGWLKGNIK